MGHGHDHSHSHSHSHAAVSFGKVFVTGIVLNLVFVAAEVLFGIRSASMALVADAAHNFGDVLSLVFSWVAFVLAKRKPSRRYTFGLKRTTILVALLNAVILLISLGVITWEAAEKFGKTIPVQSSTVIIVSSIGIFINAIVAIMFFKDRDTELNVKSAYLHMAADAAISLGVVIAGVIIHFTNWFWLDPVISIAIVLVVLVSTWRLLVESIDFALDAVPKNIRFSEVLHYLEHIEGVDEVHNLHIWGISTTETALTVHLVMPGGVPDEKFIFRVGDELHHRFGIEHSTIQVEQAYSGGEHHTRVIK